MTIVMGLDISSTCIGLSLIEEKDYKFKLLEIDSYKPNKENGIFDALLKTKEYIRSKLKEWKPDKVVIEDIAQHFAGGASSAKTIITLAIYNRTIGLTVYEELGQEPNLMNVNTVRSIIKPKGFSGKLPKEDVPEVVAAILKIDFPYIYNRKGKIADESLDRADSIAVALAFAAQDIAEKEKKAKKCTYKKPIKNSKSPKKPQKKK